VEYIIYIVVMIRKRDKRTPQKIDAMESISNLKFQQIKLDNLLRSLRMNREFNDNPSFACNNQ
jgi:hypothetical protein